MFNSYAVRVPTTDKKEEKAVEALLHSDLWRTLFRGGYQEDKDNKFTRTISGVYVSTSSIDQKKYLFWVVFTLPYLIVC